MPIISTTSFRVPCTVINGSKSVSLAREEMAAGIDVCRPCHQAIHCLIPERKELARHYNTRDKLLTHPELAKYVAWKKDCG